MTLICRCLVKSYGNKWMKVFPSKLSGLGIFLNLNFKMVCNQKMAQVATWAVLQDTLIDSIVWKVWMLRWIHCIPCSSSALVHKTLIIGVTPLLVCLHLERQITLNFPRSGVQIDPLEKVKIAKNKFFFCVKTRILREWVGNGHRTLTLALLVSEIF